MFLIQKYTQYKAAQAEQSKRKVTEKELSQLNHKIDKLLSKLDEHEPEIAANQDEECVVCVNAKATMETYPCGHRVICRKCFVKTIQMAVAQRLLPLRCVICRAKILRLKHLSGMTPISSSSSTSSSNGHQWYHVPQSASLYSVTSNTSGVSGVSSASSCSSGSSYKTCASSFSFRKSHSAYSKMGYEPLRSSSPSPTRKSTASVHSAPQPSTHSNAKSGIATMMSKKMDNRVSPAEQKIPVQPKGKLKLVQDFQREFQREFRISQQNANMASHSHSNKSRLTTSTSAYGGMGGASINSTGSGSTRIKCAKHLVNQAQSSCSNPAVSHPPGDSSRGVQPPRGSGNSRRSSSGASSSQSCPSFKQLRVSSVTSAHRTTPPSGTDKSGKLDSSPQINSSQKSLTFKQNATTKSPKTVSA